MNKALFFLILGMALVTYLPRLLPLVFGLTGALPSWLKRFLSFVPYALLSALIFPEVLYSTGSVTSAVAGALAALVLAFYRVNLFLWSSAELRGNAHAIAWRMIAGRAPFASSAL